MAAGVIPIRVPWNRPPPRGTKIDWANPITRGLVHAYPLADHNLDNAVTGELVTLVGNGISFDGTGPHSEIALTSLGTDDYVESSAIDMSLWTALTVIVWVNWDSSGSDEHSVISNFTSTDNALFVMRLEPTDDTMEWFIENAAGGTAGGTLSGSNVSPNVWHQLAGVYDPLGEGNLRGFVDGVRDGTPIAETTSMHAAPSTQAIQVGNSPFTVNDELTGEYFNALIFHRVLLDIEIMSLYKNPWQVYAPRQLLVPVGVVAASGALLRRRR